MTTGVRTRLISYVGAGETDAREATGLPTDIPKLSVSYA